MNLDLWPRQLEALNTKATEVLFGGAAGGGKSHLMRVAAIAWCLSAPGVQVVIVRREYPDLRGNHFEGRGSLPMLLMPWIAAGIVKYNVSELSITFPNGSRIVGKHCQREKDVDGFQGLEIDGLIMDELTHFSASQYGFIRSRCRTAGLKQGRFKFPRILCGSNPGGTGHNWVKSAWVDPRPADQLWEADGGWVRQFLPSRLADNPSLGAEYARSLDALPDHLRRALKDGDWNIVAGGALDDVWSTEVMREPEELPASWRRSRSFDWGSSHPFAVCWWAEADGTAASSGWCPRKGSLVMFAEWYGWNGKPNEGARMLAVEIARGVIEQEKQMRVRVEPGPADAAIYAVQNGQCIADDMARIGVRWTPSEKGPGSRVNGLELVRKRLRAAKTGEDPALYIFTTCRHAIRTLPTLPRDPKKPDDVDSDAEDHCLHPDTIVITDLGPRKISELHGETGLALTHEGRWRKFYGARMTRKDAECVRVSLDDGAEIICTEDHLILTESGWVEAKYLIAPCNLDAIGYHDLHDNDHITKMPIIQRHELLPLRELFPEEGGAIAPRSLGVLQWSNPQGIPRPSQGREQVKQFHRESGIDARQGAFEQAHEIAKNEGYSSREYQNCPGSGQVMARIAARIGMAFKAWDRINSKKNKGRKHSVQALQQAVCCNGKDKGTGVLLKQLQISGSQGGWLRQCIQGMRSLRKNVHHQQVPKDQVLFQNVRMVTEITPCGRFDVWNLEVEDDHSFTLDNGVVVHNCYDAVRYRVLTPDRQAGAVQLP